MKQNAPNDAVSDPSALGPRPAMPGEELAAWDPESDARRREWLAALAAGELALSRTAIDQVAAEGVPGMYRNLRLHVEGALAVALTDKPLYQAAAMWYGEDRSALFRALAAHPGLAHRIVGYGSYVLTGAEGDPLTAWKPMGDWVFRSPAGWRIFRDGLLLPLHQARGLQEVEVRSAPWARRFNALVYLAGDLDQGPMKDLLYLASRHGGWFTRLRARGALDRVDAIQAARRERARQDAEASAPPRPDYPDLIPLEHFDDVPVPTDTRTPRE